MRDHMAPHVPAIVAALGFRVFVPADGLQSWLYYSDGKRIAYLQYGSSRGFSTTTVNIPCKEAGTGFQCETDIELTREALERAFYVPHWASSRDRAAAIPYRDIEHWLQARHRPYVEWEPRFRLIETAATLPDGRIITGWHSFPRGADRATYDAINAAGVKAFGSNFRTAATFL